MNFEVDANIRDDWYERIDRFTNWPLLVLSLGVIPLLIYEIASDDPAWWLPWANWCIWAIFAADIAVMTCLTDNRLGELRKRWYELPICSSRSSPAHRLVSCAAFASCVLLVLFARYVQRAPEQQRSARHAQPAIC